MFLAMHAPWRGVVDIWADGARAQAVQPQAPGQSAACWPRRLCWGARSSRRTTPAGRVRRRMARRGSAWVLNCASGELWSVEDAVAAALSGDGLTTRQQRQTC